MTLQTEIDIQYKWIELVQSIKSEYLSDKQQYPWIVGFSGGKDSTVVAHAVFEALTAIPPSRRNREVHIVSNDTMVESPLVMAHLNEVTSKISNAAATLGLPIKVARQSQTQARHFGHY